MTDWNIIEETGYPTTSGKYKIKLAISTDSGGALIDSTADYDHNIECFSVHTKLEGAITQWAD